MPIKGYELDEFIYDMARWERTHAAEIAKTRARRVTAENARLLQEKQNLEKELTNNDTTTSFLIEDMLVAFGIISDCQRQQEERRRLEAEHRRLEAEHRRLEAEHRKREEERKHEEAIKKKLEQEAELMGKLYSMVVLSFLNEANWEK